MEHTFHTDTNRSLYCTREHDKVGRIKVIESIRAGNTVKFLHRAYDKSVTDQTEKQLKSTVLHAFKTEILSKMSGEDCLAWLRALK